MDSNGTHSNRTLSTGSRSCSDGFARISGGALHLRFELVRHARYFGRSPGGLYATKLSASRLGRDG